jgi:MFS transporter, ACS family, tartrate transporter
MRDIERRVIGKVIWRLIPFLIVCYFVAYLDRVNVGFLKLHMNQALGLSEAAFGLGAGLFFVGYFLFEEPNIFLEKVGARVWIARIMITWGIVSAAFAFTPSISAATGIPTTGVFYSLRLLLGACEAGLFPGIIFYLTIGDELRRHRCVHRPANHPARAEIDAAATYSRPLRAYESNTVNYRMTSSN